MKILFTSDIHGRLGLYHELVSLAKQEAVDAVILGGDLLPRQGHDDRSLRIQEVFITQELLPVLSELKDHEMAVLAILGNNDWASVLPILNDLEIEGYIHIIHQRDYMLNEKIRVLGYPFVPPTPFAPKDFEKRDLKQDSHKFKMRSPVISRNGHIKSINEIDFFNGRTSIEEDLARLSPSENRGKSIIVFHSPPYCTHLDRVFGGSMLGSRAIKQYIEIQQPFMTLHGHIHESPSVTGAYWQKIGRTICINAGQEGRRLSAVIFDTVEPERTLFHFIHGIHECISPISV